MQNKFDRLLEEAISSPQYVLEALQVSMAPAIATVLRMRGKDEAWCAQQLSWLTANQVQLLLKGQFHISLSDVAAIAYALGMSAEIRFKPLPELEKEG